MASRILMGVLPKNYQLIAVQQMRFLTSFSQKFYSTTKKTIDAMKKNESSCQHTDVPHGQVPSYEQVKNSPELQARLMKMYEEYARDPDFHAVTIDSLKWGIRSLSKENH